jgi:tRNA1(Val) A37 N6-methylase TrmN6
MGSGNGNLLPPDMRRDTLCGHYTIIQPQAGQRYTTDDMLVAWLVVRTIAAADSGVMRFLDLGSGLCSVPMVALWAYENLTGVGVEKCRRRAGMGGRSLTDNGIAQRFKLVCADLRSLRLRETFPLVTSSPPYYDAAEGPVSSNCDRAQVRFELSGGIGDYFQTAADHTNPGGYFVTAYPCRYAERVFQAAARTHFVLERQVTVVPRAGKPPLIALFAFVRSYRGRGAQETLVVRDAQQRFTPDYRAARRLIGFPDPQ